MKILFLTIGNLADLSAREIYPDLLRALLREGHEVYAVCCRERRYGKATELTQEAGIRVLRVRTGNVTQTNLLEKGVSTLMLGGLFRRAISKYFKQVSFDLILYSTPPITIAPLVARLRRKHNACTYLMLKDIFPQNAVDLGVIRPHGLLRSYFRKKETALYACSDVIGCMSPANRRYLLAQNPELSDRRVGLCPNALELTPMPRCEKSEVREQLGLPQDKLLLLYGGNLGLPQGVGFMLSCIERLKSRDDVLFVIAGAGTEYARVARFLKERGCENAVLTGKLDTQSYNRLVLACDVGLIFLDHRFTIPNFPSRLLSYLQAGIPVLAATDTATDLRDAIRDGGFGRWCESSDVSEFCKNVEALCNQRPRLPEIGENGRRYFEKHYTADLCCRAILNAVTECKRGEEAVK